LSRFFHDWDENKDGLFTYSEGLDLPYDKIVQFFDYVDFIENKKLQKNTQSNPVTA